MFTVWPVMGAVWGIVCLVRLPGPQMNNIVRELRAERGWSQAHLADLLEVSRQTVNAIETGRYDPSLPLAFAIARLFSLPIEAIFTLNRSLHDCPSSFGPDAVRIEPVVCQ
jgi:putative transcriptional regulator